jgi:ubiquinone/menaquinone biosynthesis C-methylase UbiE
MKEIFCCPECKSPLKFPNNSIECENCKKQFEIKENVFDFSNLEATEETKKTVQQFGESWKLFSHIEDYHKRQFLNWVDPLKAEDFKDRVVLEAGCGKGRHTVIVSNFQPKELYSVDLSEAIHIAQKNFQSIETSPCPLLKEGEKVPPLSGEDEGGVSKKECHSDSFIESFANEESSNLKNSPHGEKEFSKPQKEEKGRFFKGYPHEEIFRMTSAFPFVAFIRSDLKKLPFCDNSFDLIFCLGVLHHIDKMEDALTEFWRVLKPSGKLLLWVYGREGNGWIINFVNPIRKAVTSKIPTRILKILSFPLALFLYLILKAIYGPLTNWGKRESFLFYSTYLGSISPFPFKEIYSIVVDHLCPPIAYYLSRDELEKMIEPLKPSKIQFRWHNKNSWSVLVDKR